MKTKYIFIYFLGSILAIALTITGSIHTNLLGKTILHTPVFYAIISMILSAACLNISAFFLKRRIQVGENKRLNNFLFSLTLLAFFINMFAVIIGSSITITLA